MIFNESDVMDLVMQGRQLDSLKNMLVDDTVNLEDAVSFIEELPSFVPYTFENNIAVKDWDSVNQQNWHMPREYKDIDIAEYILGLCDNEAELQRCGEELLLYQERDLFNLLCYLKYLVDVMTTNQVICGNRRRSPISQRNAHG